MKANPLKINAGNMQGKYPSGSIKEISKEDNVVQMEPTIMEDITTALEQVKKIQRGEWPKRSVKQMLQEK